MLNSVKIFLIWLFNLERRKKRFILISFDILIVPICFCFAFWMRLETMNFFLNFETYIGIFIVVFTSFSVYLAFGLYNVFTRHISFEAALIIVLGSILSSTTLELFIIFLELQIPISVPLIYSTLLCAFAIGTRFFMRSIAQNIYRHPRKHVAIYGAGAAGTQLLNALKWNSNYHVRQIIDDNPDLQGHTISGISIDSFESGKKKFKELKIEILLTTIPRGVEKNRQKLLDVLSEYPLQVKTIPTITSLISGSEHISELKDLKIEDLLGRAPVEPNTKLITKNISSKVILVTGAGGSIGSELCRQILRWKPTRLILLDVSEHSIYQLLSDLDKKNKSNSVDIIPLIGSVQDINFVKRVMHKFNIDIVYHAAAYKHVPLMEQNVLQCISNNVFGTLNIAKTSISANVKNFILVSTDKAVNPTNYMGASKRFAELLCQAFNNRQETTCFSIVRFGNVLGSSGSVVPLFKQQIQGGGPVTLTHKDVTRYFMTIPEAAQLVIQAGSMAKVGEVFVLDMGKPVKIIDLAKKMITLSGFKPIFSSNRIPKKNEIEINISGLRPGEKLFEELSYNTNLTKTSHPRIMKTLEPLISFDDLERLLTQSYDAINDGDHEKLFKIIASITDGVSNIKSSNDVFIN